MVESITYKYINGNLAQEYAANWKVESQNLPSGSTIKTSEIPSQLTITVPANNTSSTRSGKIVLLQPASGKRITLNYSQVLQVEQPLSLLPKPLLVKLSLSQSLRRQ